MGKVMSHFVKRPVRNWNVENRAFREIERQKDKPKLAPLHASTEKPIQDFRDDNPGLLNEQQMKNEALHSRLGEMLAKPDKVPEPRSRSLPEDRGMREDPEYGYLEPTHVSKGFCSIRQALEFICEHHTDPKQNTANQIAQQYSLEPHNVEQILRHFKPLQVQIPKTDEKSLLASTKASLLSGDTYKNLLMKSSDIKPDTKTDDIVGAKDGKT